MIQKVIKFYEFGFSFLSPEIEVTLPLNCLLILKTLSS